MENESIFSKKSFWTVLVIGLLLIISLLVSWLWGSSNIKPVDEAIEPTQTGLTVDADAITSSLIDKKDTDGDGIPDWEEVLWETDPNKADSDDDGISDKDEIAELRLTSTSDPVDELSEADLLVRDVYLTASFLEQTGNLDEERIQLLQGEIAEDIYTQGTSQTFVLADIETTTSDKQSITEYILRVGPLLQNYELTRETVDFVATAATSKSISNEALTVLNNIKKYREALLNTVVPADFTEEHLALTNSIHSIETDFENLIFSEENVLKGVSGLVRLTDDIEAYRKSLIGMSQVFSSSKINTQYE